MSRVSRTLSRLKREGGISLKTRQQKRASSRVEGRISCFFSSCGGKLAVPLELRRGPQEPPHVASGKSSFHVSCKGPLGIPLQRCWGRSSSGVEARTLCFLSCADMYLGVPLEFQQWNQCSSLVDTCKSAFLTSCNSSVRLPVKLTYGSVAFS